MVFFSKEIKSFQSDKKEKDQQCFEIGTTIEKNNNCYNQEHLFGLG